MKSILASLFAVFGLGQASAQPPLPPPGEITTDLRSMVLGLAPRDIGITSEGFPHKVWGVVMETGMDAGHYTLVVLADGTTSLYFSTGGGIIGAGEHPAVQDASREFIGMGNRLVDWAGPAATTEPPETGVTKFFFLTFDGLLSYTAPEVDLGEERDSLAPLFHAGHAVITRVRQARP